MTPAADGPLHALRTQPWLRKALYRMLGSRMTSRPLVGGARLWFPAGRNLNLFFRRTALIEPEITRTMALLLKADAVFFDVGANIGYFTIVIAHQLRGRGKVVAVEPDPDNLPTLELNVRRNGLQNVVIEREALGAEPGRSSLYQDLTTGRTSSLEPTAWHPDGAASVNTIEVQLGTLDQLAELHGLPDLIKCDVEGHESAVIRGGSHVFRHGPILFIETVERNRSVVSAQLREHGYVYFDSELPLRGQTAASEITFSNALALPSRRVAELLKQARI